MTGISVGDPPHVGRDRAWALLPLGAARISAVDVRHGLNHLAEGASGQGPFHEGVHDVLPRSGCGTNRLQRECRVVGVSLGPILGEPIALNRLDGVWDVLTSS